MGGCYVVDAGAAFGEGEVVGQVVDYRGGTAGVEGFVFGGCEVGLRIAGVDF